MKLVSFAHKGLRMFHQEDNAKAFSADVADKIRDIFTFLEDIEHEQELRAVPSWKAHQLKGSRKGVWSLHVTRNWRLTFRIQDEEILDIDYEDYH